MIATARSAARARQPLDGADAQALEGALTMTERERDVLRAEIDVLRGVGCCEDRGPHEPPAGPCGVCLRCARAERDEWRRRAEYAERELSDALGLPATIGPAEGEAQRIMDRGRALRRELQDLRADMREPAERGDALLRHFYDRLDRALRGGAV